MHTFLYTSNTDGLPAEYKKYWVDTVKGFLEAVWLRSDLLPPLLGVGEGHEADNITYACKFMAHFRGKGHGDHE